MEVCEHFFNPLYSCWQFWMARLKRDPPSLHRALLPFHPLPISPLFVVASTKAPILLPSYSQYSQLACYPCSRRSRHIRGLFPLLSLKKKKKKQPATFARFLSLFSVCLVCVSEKRCSDDIIAPPPSPCSRANQTLKTGHSKLPPPFFL